MKVFLKPYTYNKDERWAMNDDKDEDDIMPQNTRRYIEEILHQLRQQLLGDRAFKKIMQTDIKSFRNNRHCGSLGSLFLSLPLGEIFKLILIL